MGLFKSSHKKKEQAMKKQTNKYLPFIQHNIYIAYVLCFKQTDGNLKLNLKKVIFSHFYYSICSQYSTYGETR